MTPDDPVLVDYGTIRRVDEALSAEALSFTPFNLAKVPTPLSR